MDHRDIFQHELHCTVWFRGRCKVCRKINEEKIFDYGRLSYRELEGRLDQTRHEIRKLKCSKCGAEYLPETIQYRDELRKYVILEETINYAEITDVKKMEEMERAQHDRFRHFQQHEESFWVGYVDYALSHWYEMVNELQEEEIREGLEGVGIDTQSMTKTKMRKVIASELKTIEQKEKFWRCANRFFVYDHLLSIGPLGWEPSLDMKRFGKLRVRYMVLYFPIDEALDSLRTKWIGTIVKQDRGDNEFLFRRIFDLTDELERTRARLNRLIHQVDELKLEKTRLEQKLNESYKTIRDLKENRQVVHRDPKDVSKIRELKSLVNELLRELERQERKIKELEPQAPKKEPEVLEEASAVAQEEEVNLSVLRDKTVGILGGVRKREIEGGYPCMILTHPGFESDPRFYEVLKQSDVIIVLTQFISHRLMWEAKAHAIDHDKTIIYRKEMNIERLLQSAAEAVEGKNRY